MTAEPTPPMRVLIADDHGLFRDGMRSLLEARGIDVVGEARNGREAVALARLAGYSVDQVASSLELGVDDVKKSMLQALRRVAAQPAG